MQGGTKGTNASGMRRYNEQLLLSAIRRLDGASKAELARLTGLSPQAVVRIVDQMEGEGLVYQAGRRTGGMGQPAIIYRINGERGYTVGVEIGRNGLVLILLDFDGRRLAVHREEMGFPTIQTVQSRINAFLDEYLGRLGLLDAGRLLGIGIAMPWFLGEWRDELRLSPDQADEWRQPDVAERLRTGLGWPVTFENDGNAAALAHLLGGVAKDLENFLTVHLGTFVGGGLALDGQIVRGRHGNAGALASMPVCGGPRREFLVNHASLYTLATSPSEQELAEWLDRCAEKLSFVVIGVNSLLDLEAVVVDGALPRPLIEALVAQLGDRIDREGPTDFFRPQLRMGNLGGLAVATGAALLPLHSAFNPDFSSLFGTRQRLAPANLQLTD